MQIDDFLLLVKKRRSIRTFKPDPIPEQYIEKVLEAARWAMSGGNGQPWEFIVVKDHDIRNKIIEIVAKGQKERWPIEQTRLAELRHPGWTANVTPGPPGFRDAPVIIVVCADPRAYQASAMPVHFFSGQDGGFGAIFYKNLANATQNIHLAAAALGLGSQWFTVSSPMAGPIKGLLDVPDEFDIHTLVPIGYPAYEPAQGYRRELKEIVHYDRYDRSKYRSSEDVIQFIRELRQRTTRAYEKFWGDKSA